jgi:hypothetical protein
METPPPKSPVKSGLGFMLPILAFVVAYLVFGSLGRDLRGFLDNFTTTDAEIQARLEEAFRGSKVYQALKEFYPETYQQLVAATTKDVREGASGEQAMSHAAEITTRLRRQEAANYGMASVESLRASLRSQLPHFSYLKKTYGYKACNEMAVNGAVALLKAFSPDITKDETFKKLIDDSSAVFFQTTAEGKKLKLQHAQPTDADWVVVADRLATGGMTGAELQLVGDPAKHMDDPRLCDAVLKFYEGITTMTDDASNRIIPFLAASAAAG